MWPWVSVDRHCAKIFVSLYFDIDNKFPVNFYIDDSLTKTIYLARTLLFPNVFLQKRILRNASL